MIKITAKGRPPAKNPKDIDVKIRLTKSQSDMLDYCVEKTGMTKSEVMRMGLKRVYDDTVLGKLKK